MISRVNPAIAIPRPITIRIRIKSDRTRMCHGVRASYPTTARWCRNGSRPRPRASRLERGPPGWPTLTALWSNKSLPNRGPDVTRRVEARTVAGSGRRGATVSWHNARRIRVTESPSTGNTTGLTVPAGAVPHGSTLTTRLSR
jgi:hypothetical protein